MRAKIVMGNEVEGMNKPKHLGTIDLTLETCVVVLCVFHRASADANESAKPGGLHGMLVCVVSVLPRNDEESSTLLFPSKACHFFNAWGKVNSRSMP